MKNKIKELRINQNLSQDDLAKAIDVSRQTINAIENDRYNPTIELAIKLSQRLNVSIEELFIVKRSSENSIVVNGIKLGMKSMIINGLESPEKEKFLNDLAKEIKLKSLADELEFALIDFKLNITSNEEKYQINTISGLIKNDKEYENLLIRLDKVMIEREKLFKGVSIDVYNETAIEKIKKIVLLVKDYHLIFDVSQNVIEKVALMGKHLGIQIILSFPFSDRNVISKKIHDNITNRICFKVSNSIDSEKSIGVAGAETLASNEFYFRDGYETIKYRTSYK